MAATPDTTRKVAAGVAAVLLTFCAAGAAVAVNLGTGGGVDTPAGRLVATEPVSTPEVTAPAPTPSTIYVDLTVPAPATTALDPAAPAPTVAADPDPTVAAGPSSVDDRRDGDDDHDQADEADDHDRRDDDGDDEGADDDD